MEESVCALYKEDCCRMVWLNMELES